MKRRDAVKLITITGVAGVANAQHGDHKPTRSAERGTRNAGAYKPKYFSAREFEVITRLADLIIPRDSTPGALDAKAHEYIDLQVSHMPEAQVTISGGVQWLDRYCAAKFGQPFVKCSAAQQKQVLDGLAYKDRLTPELRPGRGFFVLVRSLTCDGFYSSKLGFAEVGYKGNQFVTEFKGCTHPEHGA